MHDDGIFDETIAARYDETSAAMFAPDVLEPTIDFLAELAGTGRALEFAIGTGRVALPLRQRGVPVSGIELSEPMLAKLNEKDGAETIDITVGNMTTATAAGDFRLVYLVYNTIGNVETQDAQVAVFENASRHLESGGFFVVEVGVPELRRLPAGQKFLPFHVSENRWGIDEIDVVSQHSISHHFRIVDGVASHFACPYRYVWPSELDLMARLAGLELRQRWSDWNRRQFTAESRSHVSVWQKP